MKKNNTHTGIANLAASKELQSAYQALKDSASLEEEPRAAVDRLGRQLAEDKAELSALLRPQEAVDDMEAEIEAARRGEDIAAAAKPEPKESIEALKRRIEVRKKALLKAKEDLGAAQDQKLRKLWRVMHLIEREYRQQATPAINELIEKYIEPLMWIHVAMTQAGTSPQQGGTYGGPSNDGLPAVRLVKCGGKNSAYEITTGAWQDARMWTQPEPGEARQRFDELLKQVTGTGESKR